MSASGDNVVLSLMRSFAHAKRSDRPYRYWLLTSCLPLSLVDEVLALPFSVADLAGVSGKRELHNATRSYFDPEARAKHACVSQISNALQDERVIAAIEEDFGAKLGGTYLRIEYAQDVDGFWLEPHTDIGVKAFTFLLYLSKDPAHADLGTDVYDAAKSWVGRTPYASNAGMIFVPSTTTYHGFEKRQIAGVRKLLVVNYVTSEWRAREQLAFPDRVIASKGLVAAH
jgi:hypothetical protein